MRQKVIIAVLIYTLGLSVQAQQKKAKRVRLLNGEKIVIDKKNSPDEKKIYGNVRFKHNNAIMDCDSAYFNKKKNSFEAFSNVVITKDTIVLKGDYLKYNGQNKMANVRNNVTLEDGKVTLYTDILDYNMETDIGYYPDLGKLVDETNQLTSKRGVYYQKEQKVDFLDSVEVVTPDSFMASDTMVYYTNTEVVEIVGPTDIYGTERDSTKDYSYATKGYYDTKNEILNVSERIYIRKENHTLYSDSVYYVKKDSTIFLYDNIIINDLENSLTAYGDEAEYYENIESFYLSDYPYVKQVSQEDTLFFRGDTIRGVTTIEGVDTTRLLTAYNNVRMFRSNFQAMCDSISFSSKDSVIRMFQTPVMWHEEYQLTAQQVDIITKNKEVEQFKLNKEAFICNKVDSLYFNQISANNMIGFVKDRQLTKLDAIKNAITLYYPQDSLITVALNRIESRDLEFFFAKDKSNKSRLKKMKFISKPQGVTLPLLGLKESDMKLRGFVWYEEYRPKSKYDIINYTHKDIESDENSESKIEIPSIKEVEVPDLKRFRK